MNRSFDLEMNIIEFYSYYVDKKHNTIKDFTNFVLSTKQYKTGKYRFTDIEAFYDTRRFLNNILQFISYLDYLIIGTIGYNFENVWYNKTIEDNDKLIIEVCVCYEY